MYYVIVTEIVKIFLENYYVRHGYRRQFIWHNRTYFNLIRDVTLCLSNSVTATHIVFGILYIEDIYLITYNKLR